jgi:hypothetical protein
MEKLLDKEWLSICSTMVKIANLVKEICDMNHTARVRALTTPLLYMELGQ